MLKHFDENKDNKKVAYTKFVGTEKEERIISFLPLLHLEDQKKVWLEQEIHFDEIYIWLKETYLNHNPDPLADLRKELEEEIKELELDKESKKRLKKTKKEFKNPIGE